MRSTAVPKRAKRLRYSRRAQRHNRAQKARREEQRRFSAVGIVERDDRRVGIARWQQQRVTLSQLIVPSEGHSRQETVSSAQIKIQREQKKQKQPVEEQQQQQTKTAKKKAQKEAKRKSQTDEKKKEHNNCNGQNANELLGGQLMEGKLTTTTKTTKLTTMAPEMVDGKPKKAEGKSGKKTAAAAKIEKQKKKIIEQNEPVATMGMMDCADEEAPNLVELAKRVLMMDNGMESGVGLARDGRQKNDTDGGEARGGGADEKGVNAQLENGFAQQENGINSKKNKQQKGNNKGKRGKEQQQKQEKEEEEKVIVLQKENASVEKQETQQESYCQELTINVDGNGTNSSSQSLLTLTALACKNEGSNGMMLLQAEEDGDGGHDGNEMEMEAPLTICSVDSGVDLGNGEQPYAAHEQLSISSADASPKCSESHSNNINDDVDVLLKQQQKTFDRKQQTDAGGNAVNNNNNSNGTDLSPKSTTTTKFEQRVYELVDQLQERVHVQTTLVASNERVAPLLVPLKVEPLNLERIKPMEIVKREKRPRLYRLLDSDIQYCQYMEQNYGEDYEAMSRDPRNLFCDSASSMRRKLRIYKDFLKQNINGVA